MKKGGVNDRWNKIFRTACELEADVFNTGLQVPMPYQIVPNGTYTIQGSSAAERVVLANKNVESFLRSPFDKRRLGAYFPSDAGSSVVGVNKTGGNNEKVIWRCIWSLLVLKLTHCIVACRPNRSWIYVPKRGDWSLSWNCHRTKSKRRPNFASRCQTVQLVD